MSILVVGAGPTGLVLALQLARRGVAFEIISAAREPGTTSRAIAIHARTLEFYDQLGFADEILSLGTIAQTVRLRHNGKDFARIALGKIGQGLSRFPFVFTLAQDDHERFLILKLQELGVGIRWNCTLVSLEQHPDHVSVLLRSGAKEEHVDYTYVCGCDGAHSAVRHALDVQFEGGTYEGLFYVADVETDTPSAGELVAHLEAGTFALMMPVRRNGGVRLVGIVDGGNEKPNFEQLQPGIEHVIGTKVQKLNWFSTYRVHHRLVSQFRSGRCFLLGDAAHLHSPAGGQGMNTGIGDATNLAWKLAAVIKNEAPETLLESYDLERRPFAKQLVETTDRVFKWVVDRGIAGTLLRQFLLARFAPIAMRLGPVRAAFFRRVSQIAITYRDGRLSSGEVGLLRGGDRFPFIKNENASTVHCLEWIAITYGSTSEEIFAELAKRGIALQNKNWSTNAENAGLQEGALYLVRPDGYIGLADPAPSAVTLTRYLDFVMGRPG